MPNRRVSLQFLKSGRPIHVRHHHIQEDGIGLISLAIFNPSQPELAVNTFQPATISRLISRHFPDIVFIINNKNSWFLHRRRLSLCPEVAQFSKPIARCSNSCGVRRLLVI